MHDVNLDSNHKLNKSNQDSKKSSVAKNRNLERLQKRTKKGEKMEEKDERIFTEAVNHGRNEVLKNNINSTPITSSSSALSSLMGMVECRKLQERIREHQPVDFEKEDENNPNVKYDNDDMNKEFQPESLNDNHTNENESNTTSSSVKLGNRVDRVVEENDIKVWPSIMNEDTRKDHENNEYNNLSRKRSYQNNDTQPTTAESKFFRFSALAKELSGR